MQASNNNHTSVKLLVTACTSPVYYRKAGSAQSSQDRQVFTLLKELSCY